MNKTRTAQRLLPALLALALLFAGWPLPGSSARAQEVGVIIDGEPLEMEVPAQIINGCTMVPMRAIFEKLGATVSCDYSCSRSISGTNNNGTNIQLILDSNEAWVNSQHVYLDAAPVVVDDRVLVPLRFVATSLGAEVSWDGANNNAVITSKSGQKAYKSVVWTGPASNPGTPQGWIYFINWEDVPNSDDEHSVLYRVPADGSAAPEEILGDEPYKENIQVYDNKLYYSFYYATENWPDGTYEFDPVKNQVSRFELGNIGNPWTVGDRIYSYLLPNSSSGKPTIRAVDRDGGGYKDVIALEAIDVNTLVAGDGVLFFYGLDYGQEGMDASYALYSVNTDGSNLHKYPAETTYRIINCDVSGSTLYWRSANKDGIDTLWKAEAGGNPVNLGQSDPHNSGLQVEGDWIYYSVNYGNNDTTIHRIRTDGTQDEQVGDEKATFSYVIHDGVIFFGDEDTSTLERGGPLSSMSTEGNPGSIDISHGIWCSNLNYLYY